MKIAIVIGATGLVGSALTKMLLDDNRYSHVHVFTRRGFGIKDPKLIQHIVDFNRINEWKDDIQGDDLFSCMGTTIKKAGSQDNQWLVDYTYQYKFAKYASENEVSNYYLISSAGANSSSKLFYSRMKGKLDDDVRELPFNQIVIFRPSFLVGDRHEKRALEKFGAQMGYFITRFAFKSYKPIKDIELAKAILVAANKKHTFKKVFYTLGEIWRLIE